MIVRCLAEPGSVALDTESGAVVSPAPAGAVALLEGVEVVRRAVGLGGVAYMDRALACAALSMRALEVLYPPGPGEHPSRRMGCQGATLRRIGQQVRPEVAALLVELGASARVCEAAARRVHGGDPARQRAAAMLKIAGVSA